MVRINKHALPEAQLKKLYGQLSRIMSETSSENMNDFLQVLLGKEERLMLAKRLAAVVMLKEGYSSYRIAQTLKLSASTIKSIKTKQAQSTFKPKRMHTESYKAIVDIIDSLLTVGGIMPRRVGLERYRGLQN